MYSLKRIYKNGENLFVIDESHILVCDVIHSNQLTRNDFGVFVSPATDGANLASIANYDLSSFIRPAQSYSYSQLIAIINQDLWFAGPIADALQVEIWSCVYYLVPYNGN